MPDKTLIGAGISVRLGQAISSFKSEHANASCYDVQGMLVCLFANTIGPCPTEAPCSDPSFAFVDGVLSGFSATYNRVDWSQALEAATSQFGSSREMIDLPVLNMRVVWRYWELDNGEMALAHWTGSDYMG